jgi:rod shape determining protein RodA
MMFDRRLVENFDWWLLVLTLLVVACGLVTLYSAVRAGSPSVESGLYTKQLIWCAAGLMVMVGAFLINYRSLDRFSYAIYSGCLALLLLVLVFGRLVAGSRRWLILGPISLQPSELIKVALILVLAHYYARVANTEGFRLRELAVPLALTLVPFALIVHQPDLGTALMLVLIAGSITAFVKIERKSLVLLSVLGAMAIPSIWFFLKGYQKQRILTFLNPDRDPLGAGYHIIQSKIAIGSGMITGKGFLHGTQNVLSFLPEHHTDFIFSVLSEEWGFVGSVTLLVLFLVLILWALNIAHGCRDPFGTIVSVGVASMLFWQVFINVGMVMGLMPVVGVPLPLISYGGSSLITNLACIGLLLNVRMRRFVVE